MSPTDADDLTKRIINTWRGGPPLSEWRTELKELDQGIAGTAYVRLKRTSEHAPSIAKFLAEYRAVRGPDDTPRWEPYEERISLAQYLERLTKRSIDNPEAEAELGAWDRWLSGKKTA